MGAGAFSLAKAVVFALLLSACSTTPDRATAPEQLVVERRKPWPDLGTVSVGLYRHPDGANGAGQRLADYLMESLDVGDRKQRRRAE